MRFRHLKKNLWVLILLASVFMLTGFGLYPEMPYNGDIVFHGVALTIPDSFIRDSTQSNPDYWIFEKGFYKKVIILSRSDYSGNTGQALDDYANDLREMGLDVWREAFLQKRAVFSEYAGDDAQHREVLFAHKGSLYAIALRGGNAEEFRSLLEGVHLELESNTEDREAAKEDTSTMFSRMEAYFSD